MEQRLIQENSFYGSQSKMSFMNLPLICLVPVCDVYDHHIVNICVTKVATEGRSLTETPSRLLAARLLISFIIRQHVRQDCKRRITDIQHEGLRPWRIDASHCEESRFR